MFHVNSKKLHENIMFVFKFNIIEIRLKNDFLMFF